MIGVVSAWCHWWHHRNQFVSPCPILSSYVVCAVCMRYSRWKDRWIDTVKRLGLVHQSVLNFYLCSFHERLWHSLMFSNHNLSLGKNEIYTHSYKPLGTGLLIQNQWLLHFHQFCSCKYHEIEIQIYVQ